LAGDVAQAVAPLLEETPTAVNVGIVWRDELIIAKSFGWADVEARRAADAANLFRIASITKAITVTLMMRLVERGVFGLKDSIAQYVPEIADLPGRAADAPPITFESLATHTAGLAKEAQLPGAKEGSSRQWDQIVVRAIPTVQPGEGYSNFAGGGTRGRSWGGWGAKGRVSRSWCAKRCCGRLG
jgi:CubicO group peptidase (beta-lactamase class C family)